MSTPFIIIDGYNLLHAAGLARVQYGPGDLDRCRQRLLAMLCETLSDEQRLRCTIVFDACEAPTDHAHEYHYRGMLIRYSPGDADSDIEQLLQQHPATRQVVVVSSDVRLQTAIKRKKGRFIKSDDFLKFTTSTSFQDASQPAPEQRPLPQDLSERELHYWMQEFAGLSLHDLKHAELVAELQESLQKPQSPESRTSAENQPASSQTQGLTQSVSQTSVKGGADANVANRQLRTTQRVEELAQFQEWLNSGEELEDWLK